METGVRFLAAGDRCLVAEFGDEVSEGINAAVRGFARAVEQSVAGVEEVVPTIRSAAVFFDPLAVDADDLRVRLEQVARRPEGAAAGRTVVIPAVYGGEWGPDLADVAAHAGLAPEEVVRLHAEGEYTVYMLGFLPGFAYLGGLSPRIACPRLPRPRQEVPPGSVGIAETLTGVYPSASPGGWRIIGRTPLRLYDPAREPPTLLQPGDRVRFEPISPAEYERLRREVEAVAPGEAAPAAAREGGAPGGELAGGRAGGAAGITVLDPGLFTTVQDLGRPGYQRLGVPVAGALDALALRAANRLVGNPDGAAGLEITLLGPRLRFEGETVIALAGADLGASLDGRPLAPGESVAVREGTVLSFSGPRSGARAYLAVAGGIDVPPVLGSRSTCVRAALGGVGGRALRKGDVLPVGPRPEAALPGRRLPAGAVPLPGRHAAVRVMPGPQDDYFTEETMGALVGSRYRVTAASDRMGYRLDGPRLVHRGRAEIISDAIPLGAVQVPGQGLPIVLLADRQTTGGYPKIATVVSADVRLLAQLQPYHEVSFRLCTREEAVRALREQEEALDAIC